MSSGAYPPGHLRQGVDALAALQSAEQASNSVHLVLEGSLDAIEACRRQVDPFAASAGVSAEVRNRIEVVLEEVIANVVRHGIAGAPGKSIGVSVTLEPKTVRLVIDDDAPFHDPLQRPDHVLPDDLGEAQVGGLGVHLVRKMSSHLAYEAIAAGVRPAPLHHAGNRLTIWLRAPEL
jgi:anti-sigma regulatory factor (Ser/Thr protein kinase)